MIITVFESLVFGSPCTALNNFIFFRKTLVYLGFLPWFEFFLRHLDHLQEAAEVVWDSTLTWSPSCWPSPTTSPPPRELTMRSCCSTVPWSGLQKNVTLACMFHDYSWKSCVSDYFNNVEYQDLCATINPSKIKDLENKNNLWNICAALI